ncbi:GFA family protein [Chelativorans sp. SCAU2101]|jgi:Uncharacterized conserved protein|uniref:GFA family protein n=1 Tax=Chelativorans petroleitrophicus TaxID=2975484 RepID=A0A9X2X6N2_9HYPH|nr:GFA family protein [Chelativorans petroleitrophicus]MCT8989613.1 GFA family protein [Chelativorans petroleitrophicus]
MAMQYKGSCHCGAVRFRADVDLSNPIVCNCSYCQRRGSMLAFTPVENFELEQGEENLTEYRFNTRQIRHLFCKTCGMESFALGQRPDGARMAAINVRCLEDVDPDNLQVTKVDGRSR